ncbi:Transglutaminase-like enzyme, putative cysteine protease [Blastococcus fimeti]|nr:Transglutaminase-like enzyme, putative cysteine protease [Blastococcus fimeti]
MTTGDVRTALAAAAATLLGAFALSPVLSSGTWIRPVVHVVLVVLLTGLALRFAGAAVAARALRGRPVPAAVTALGIVLVPLGQLAALTGYLTRRFTEAGGLLPTPAGVSELAALLRDGVDEISEQVAPALPVASLTALIAVFVGLVAVLVDVLAVAGRQGALAGLALLVLVGVPVFTLGGDIGLLPVVAPAAGFALLLWADQAGRLEAAGRVSGPRSVGGSTALRIGGVAVLVGVLGGGMLPTLAEGTASGGEGTGSTGTRLDPVAAMYGQLTRNDPVDLLRLDTSLPDPGYLRAVTVDRYDTADGWTLNGPEAQLPLTSQLPTGHYPESGRPFSATIEAIGHDDRFLPVPVAPESVDITGGENGWRFDPVTDTVVGRDVSSRGRRYEVTASEVRPSPEQLQAAPALPDEHPDRVRFTALPDDLDPRVTDQVRDLVDGAAPGYARVRRILDFLTDGTNGFRYALSTSPGTSGDDLVDFLDGRQGYCEQYAGAMAVMVRAAGMPARVALGYTPGTLQDDGTRLITSDDAHAWVEVFFVDLGWVPFDPTPIDVDRRADLPWAPRVATEDLPEQTPELQQEVPPELLLLDPQYPLVPGGGEASDGAVPEAAPEAEESWAAPVGLALLALALAAAGAPAGVRLLQRRRRLSRGTAAALWDELTATADDLGVPRDPAWTPREAGRALAERTGPAGAAAIARLARAEELAGYGPATAAQEEGLDAALGTARQELHAGVDRRARLRAAFWPASLPAAMHAGLPAWVRGWAEMRRSRRPGGRRLRAGGAGS